MTGRRLGQRRRPARLRADRALLRRADAAAQAGRAGQDPRAQRPAVRPVRRAPGRGRGATPPGGFRGAGRPALLRALGVLPDDDGERGAGRRRRAACCPDATAARLVPGRRRHRPNRPSRGPDVADARHHRLRQPVGLAGRHPAAGLSRRARGGPGVRGGPPRPQDDPQQGRPAPGLTCSPASAPDAEARPATDAADLGRPSCALVERPPTRSAGQKGGAVVGRRERRAGADGDALRPRRSRPPTTSWPWGCSTAPSSATPLARVERLADGGLLGVIDDLYVDPGARAVGVGEALMNHLLDWCRGGAASGSTAWPCRATGTPRTSSSRSGWWPGRSWSTDGFPDGRDCAATQRCARVRWRSSTTGCSWCGGPWVPDRVGGRCRADGSSLERR